MIRKWKDRYYRWKNWCEYTFNVSKFNLYLILFGIKYNESFENWKYIEGDNE